MFKKIFKKKIKLAKLMAFKHCISFVTDLLANFACYQFRIIPEIFPKLLSKPP